LANKSGGSESGTKSSRLVNSDTRKSATSSRGSTKSRTTSENGVAVAQSDNLNTKSKKPMKKSKVIEVSDSEDDDLLEREAALASPAKGSESRKDTKASKILYMFPVIC
jgi:hypothetical protein